MRAIPMSVCLAVLISAAACGPAKPAESPSHSDEESSPPATSGPSGASDAPSHAAPVAVPAEPAAPAGGGVPYDKESVEIGLKRSARQVKANCGALKDADGNPSGPWGKGTVTVKLGHNGHGQGATVAAPFDGKPVGRCITQAFAILIYPPFAGADTTVDWPIEVPEPPAAAPPPKAH